MMSSAVLEPTESLTRAEIVWSNAEHLLGGSFGQDTVRARCHSMPPVPDQTVPDLIVSEAVYEPESTAIQSDILPPSTQAFGYSTVGANIQADECSVHTSEMDNQSLIPNPNTNHLSAYKLLTADDIGSTSTQYVSNIVSDHRPFSLIISLTCKDLAIINDMISSEPDVPITNYSTTFANDSFIDVESSSSFDAPHPNVIRDAFTKRNFDLATRSSSAPPVPYQENRLSDRSHRQSDEPVLHLSNTFQSTLPRLTASVSSNPRGHSAIISDPLAPHALLMQSQHPRMLHKTNRSSHPPKRIRKPSRRSDQSSSPAVEEVPVIARALLKTTARHRKPPMEPNLMLEPSKSPKETAKYMERPSPKMLHNASPKEARMEEASSMPLAQFAESPTTQKKSRKPSGKRATKPLVCSGYWTDRILRLI